jgi:1-acyl-sn-glycerol-3-phosphate acyltransferase
MIKAKHHPLVYGFFKAYAHLRIRKTFQDVVVRGEVESSGKAILLLANHTSWWDGFWALYLNRICFQRKFHFMMDENELSRRWLFAHSGGFSIRPDSRSLFDSLYYTGKLLTNPENLVLIYPQGRLFSSHTSDVKFKRGIERLRFTEGEVPDVYFLVQLTDYFQYEKPTLYFYLKKAPADIFVTRKFEAGYNVFYKQTLEQHSSLTV